MQEQEGLDLSELGNMENVQDASGQESANDMDWDNIEETAPPIEAESSEQIESKEDGESNESIERNADSNGEKSEDQDIESIGKEATEESRQADSKTESIEDKNTGGESKSAKEDSEQLVKVKVDGEEQEVSLQELKNNYAGKTAWDKKFSELDKERKQYKQEVEYVNKYVDDLGKTMKNAGLLDGLYKIGELVDMPPHEIKQQLINQMLPEIQRLNQMSEQEKELEFKKQELDYNKNKLESDKKRSSAEQAQRELEQKINSVREAHNIDETEWNDAFQYLDKNLPKEEAITPDTVADYVDYKRTEGRANEVLSQYNKDLLEDSYIFGQVHQTMYENPQLSNEDMIELLQKAGAEAKQNHVEKKVKKVSEKKQKKEEKVEKPAFNPLTSEEGNEIDDWNDLL